MWCFALQKVATKCVSALYSIFCYPWLHNSSQFYTNGHVYMIHHYFPVNCLRVFHFLSVNSYGVSFYFILYLPIFCWVFDQPISPDTCDACHASQARQALRQLRGGSCEVTGDGESTKEDQRGTHGLLENPPQLRDLPRYPRLSG